MKRTLEPEIMNNEEQTLAYAKADFSSSNQLFVEQFFAEYSPHIKHVLDIGCGPADVPIRLAHKITSIRITAIDASAPMVKLARQAVMNANLQTQINIVKGRIPGLNLENIDFEAIISKDLLHHLPDPTIFWQELRSFVKRSTFICIMDLIRPDNIQDAKAIVESISEDEPDILKKDFYNSLLAAFTIDEVTKQCHSMRIELSIRKVSERHFLATGILDESQ